MPTLTRKVSSHCSKSSSVGRYSYLSHTRALRPAKARMRSSDSLKRTRWANCRSTGSTQVSIHTLRSNSEVELDAPAIMRMPPTVSFSWREVCTEEVENTPANSSNAALTLEVSV